MLQGKPGAGTTGAGTRAFETCAARAGAGAARRHGIPTVLRTCSATLLLALGSAFAGAGAVECDPGGTAFERNYCAAQEQHAAELALGAVVERARGAFADDPHALAALQRANRAWADYVAATLATAFPCAHDDLALCYGEGTPLCVARLRTRLARERQALLEMLLARPPGPHHCE
ncbi:MAG: lysozyme inhibitor LprI family protein [Gammaproteobacteria bacterium]